MKALQRARRPYAVIGGLAVSVRAEPRFTRDVDLAVVVATDSEAEELVLSLSATGFRPLASVEHDSVGRLSTVRLLAPGEPVRGVVVDLLFASSGIEPEIIAAADTVELLEGLSAPVAKTGHLIALKALSRNDVTRPQDAADLRLLLAQADPTEIERARAAAALIVARGYDRGRALTNELEELIRESRPPEIA
jgi:predicted nucleotidyltransferase